MEELIKLAQEKVGTAYMKGTNGTEKNLFEALKYFELAANNGSAMANYQMGKAYEKGNGVNCDIEKAKKYYKKSADMGYINAVNTLKQLDNKEQSTAQSETISNTAKYQAPEVAKSQTYKINEKTYSSKTKVVAITLAIILGGLGVHNWYLGKKKIALIQTLIGITGVGLYISWAWAIIEIFTGKIKIDSEGRELV